MKVYQVLEILSRADSSILGQRAWGTEHALAPDTRPLLSKTWLLGLRAVAVACSRTVSCKEASR